MWAAQHRSLLFYCKFIIFGRVDCGVLKHIEKNFDSIIKFVVESQSFTKTVQILGFLSSVSPEVVKIIQYLPADSKVVLLNCIFRS